MISPDRSPTVQQDARDGLQDVRVIADILRALAISNTGAGQPIAGSSLNYIAKQLDRAAVRTSAAVREMGELLQGVTTGNDQ